jgi:hypothetical protein
VMIRMPEVYPNQDALSNRQLEHGRPEIEIPKSILYEMFSSMFSSPSFSFFREQEVPCEPAP